MGVLAVMAGSNIMAFVKALVKVMDERLALYAISYFQSYGLQYVLLVVVLRALPAT